MLNSLMLYYRRKILLLSQPRLEQCLLRLLHRVFPKPCRLLEAGSNSGHLSMVLSQEGYEVTLLDCFEEPIRIAQKEYSKKKLIANYIVDDILNVQGNWDGVWNTGLIQSYNYPMRKLLVAKLCQLAPSILLIYPKVEHPGFPIKNDQKIRPGFEGCTQYPVPELPFLVSEYYKVVRHGNLSAENLGLTFPFEYIWGEKSA